MNKQNFYQTSSIGHVTGNSEFIDDRPSLKGELLVDFLGSPIACGILKNIDISKALGVSGIDGIFTYRDLKKNKWGAISQDQPILVEKEINYIGEPICVLAGSNREVLDRAKKLIEVDIVPIEPIRGIADAIKKDSFLHEKQEIETGNVREALFNARNKLVGDFFSGSQDHFYLESHASIAYPDDENCLTIYSSSQHPSEVSHVVAEALGLSQGQVICIVKRMGGGFGGKESQAAHFAVMAGLVALKLNKSARIVLDKDTDMKTTGKRHPFYTTYHVGFQDSGRVVGLEAKLYGDAGAYVDLSPAILGRALFHLDNAYDLQNVLFEGQLCKTNNISNTAFRGFGGPQGAAVIENIMDDIGHYLRMDPFEIRKINLYGVGGCDDITPYGQHIDNNTLSEVVNKLAYESEYIKRRALIIEKNKEQNKYVYGIGLTPVKFGISFTTKFLNQGNALVHVYLDGSVACSTGATEMGQGVYAKIQQVVCEEFALSRNRVRILSTSTDKNANTSATAASSGADINCSAAIIAVNKIKLRMASYVAWISTSKDRKIDEEFEILDPNSLDSVIFINEKIIHQNSGTEFQFKDIVEQLYKNRVDLSARGFYKTPNIHYDLKRKKGTPFLYYTIGAAVSEICIDILTGELKLLRTDILMDLGRPINEGIDRGQIAGAFVQGLGWVTTEEVVYGADMSVLSHSPTTYKIPNIHDIPRQFNIELIENRKHSVNVRKSKAVGEPPFLLGLSVFSAIKMALYQFHGGDRNIIKLQLPATHQEILSQLYPGEIID
ncbi:molybdopterin-dependent oxidoreductase [Bacteriovoracaceae bacterium]|nr:molybdopterin-dependent oxidoreductase [Bacteriovoracaceae bacterium]